MRGSQLLRSRYRSLIWLLYASPCSTALTASGGSLVPAMEMCLSARA